MSEPETSKNQLHQLIEEVKTYLFLQRDMLKIEGVEKLTILISSFLLLTLLIVLGTGALFYLLFALAYVLAPYVGGIAMSFTIIGCIFLLILAIVFSFRKSLIINPIVRFLADLFLKKDTED
ncbi:phage holin family protein [Coprobacter tertius]|uniref:Phage holin family protein n=1 Tax=Coprobacter tertius TaxID=2944915 RepID=A0ABT1MID6_9BACT|nr:phage holin family protein [Coprobacter tertius]MCP9612134.1 phage holin family protein [Coprobacter tertius]